MGKQILPRPVNIVFYSGAWPRADVNEAINAAGNFDGVGRQRGSPGGLTVWGGLVGTANNQMELFQEQLGGRFDSGAGTFSERHMDGFRAQFPLAQVASGSPFRVAEWQRVYRADLAFAVDQAGNLGTDGGMAWILQPGGGADGSYPSGVGVGAGFGIQGDGAGGLQFFSKNTLAGGFNEQVALAWPSALTNLVYVGWELRGATGVGPASMRLFLNGVLALTRAWGPGTVLPDYDSLGGPGNSNGVWKLGIRNATNGKRIHISSVQFLSGRFTIDDVEQLNSNFLGSI